MPVHAFDQTETLLGQGTVGMELEQDAPDIDTLLVAVGGGGLIGGIAAWYGGPTRGIAVPPGPSPTLPAAIEAGQPGDAPPGRVATPGPAPRRRGAAAVAVA